MNGMKELYEKVSKDTTLQEKFTAIMKDAEKAGEAATGEKLAVFAKEAGFDVTIEEMKDFFKEMAEKKEGALSDAELDAVAGGKGGVGLFVSILGFGMGCGIASALVAIASVDCKDFLDRDIVAQ